MSFTPQLKQALEILKMSSEQLSEYIKKQLVTNPVLEIDENEDSSTDDRSMFESLQKLDYDSNWENEQTNYSSDFNDISSFVVDKKSVHLSLEEYLLFQLHTSKLDKRQVLIGEYLINSINENGYLTIELSEIAALLNVSVLEVQKVLEYLQSFDPPGVFARDLKECLLIQLKQMNKLDCDIKKIINSHLEDLGENRIPAIAKSTGLSIKKINEIYNFIKTLNPKPGKLLCVEASVNYIVPDVIVKKVGNELEIIINKDVLPSLRINKYYKDIMSNNINDCSSKFIKKSISDAEWLIRCIEQRFNTLRNIVESIVAIQRDFFIKGKHYLKPLTLKDISKNAGVHESTVSRAIRGKYIQCSWGVFELKYFFSKKIPNKSGRGVSSEIIKNILKNVIDSEDKLKPLTDGEITKLLTSRGMKVSRRTVAKYRMELGLPEAGKRKRYS